MKIQINPEWDEKELEELRSSIKKEASHFQWAKQALCLTLLASLILLNLCMGSASRESIIGIQKCDSAYWLVQIAFVVICIIFTFLAVRMAKHD